MRKYQLIIAVVAISSLLTAGGVTAAISYNKRVNAQAAAVTDAEKAKQLKEWEESVRKWQEQEQAKTHAATTGAQSDLSQQGVAMLPETGPADVVATFIVVSVLGMAAYYTSYRLRNSYLGN